MRVRFAAASGYCREHWRDVCACRVGSSGTRVADCGHWRDDLALSLPRASRADGKTNVGWVVFLVIAYPLSVSYLVFFVLLMVSAFTGESVTVG